MTQQFVGFADSDKFLAACDRSRPVNLSVTRKHGKPGRYGIAIDASAVTLSQVQGSEALYFEHVFHRYQTANGELFGDKERSALLAGQVLAAAKQYLEANGVTWREAMLSIPANLTTLDGEATFLAYDKERGYFLKEESHD